VDENLLALSRTGGKGPRFSRPECESGKSRILTFARSLAGSKQPPPDVVAKRAINHK